MSGYDSWLESPYTNAARYEAEYEAWCETKGYDPATPHWEEFEAAMAELQPDPDEERG